MGTALPQAQAAATRCLEHFKTHEYSEVLCLACAKAWRHVAHTAFIKWDGASCEAAARICRSFAKDHSAIVELMDLAQSAMSEANALR